MRSKAAVLRRVALAVAIFLLPDGASARDWVAARSPGFLVISDAGGRQAQVVAHQLEQVRSLFRQVFQARVDTGQMVVVFAVRDESGLRELLGEHPAISSIAGVFMSGLDKHFVALRLDTRSELPYRVIYHEYVHLLARLNFRWLPTWLSEGLAEFYSTADIDEAQVKWGTVSGHHISVLRSATMIPLTELMAATRDSPLYNEGHRRGPFYAQSALLTHYLLLGEPERRGQLGRYVKLLEQDVPEKDAAREAFGDLKKLQSDLFDYARRLGFNAVKADIRLSPAQITVIPLKQAEADAVRGDFLVRRGALREARKLLDAALARDPDQAVAHEALGVLESFGGRRGEAVRHLTEAARLAPMSHVAPFRLGLLENAGDPADRARRERALRSAIRINAGFAPAYAQLARLLLKDPEPTEEAANLAARAAALDPGYAGYRVILWHALERLGRKDKAAKIEAPLRRAALADAQTLLEMADHLEDIGQAAQAEELIRAARATNPAATFVLTEFLTGHGRWDEAEALQREELAREPKAPTRMNSLAYTLGGSGRNLDEALRLIDRALKQKPKNPFYLDTKGVILSKMNRLPEAEAVLRQSAGELPDPEVFDHLADVLAARGKSEEALAEYERALNTPGLKERMRNAIIAKVARMKAEGAPPSPATPVK